MFLQRKEYDTEVKALAMFEIERVRPLVHVDYDTMTKGRRFKDDEYVLTVLESLTTQKDFLEYPIRAVEAALIVCAETDYYYTNEKDWGIDEDEERECYIDEENIE